ncbi:hypothetical protein E1301_Tti002120 [Triplophysa tibetana]|uniref:Uncharacterized protein n=1 Tax=Triplophysa tibetana TaxID=1572043 RepID=A0A5A9PI64_9TELE|nr:hypothetical protein E1301_Tti002120 [Triplophysa tibetana]
MSHYGESAGKTLAGSSSPPDVTDWPGARNTGRQQAGLRVMSAGEDCHFISWSAAYLSISAEQREKVFSFTEGLRVKWGPRGKNRKGELTSAREERWREMLLHRLKWYQNATQKPAGSTAVLEPAATRLAQVTLANNCQR